MTTLVLASASPRRRDLLERFGHAVAVRPAHVDETPAPGEDAADLVRRLAVAKAEAVLARAPEADVMVLGADTVVVLDGEVLGKPVDGAAASDMLGRLSGRTHRVLTGVAVAARRSPASAPSGSLGLGPATSTIAHVEATEVTFSTLTDADISWYVATGEPLDKAGAYGIQGIGAMWVSSIRGSWDNVVGLPLGVTRGLLAEVGLDVPGPGSGVDGGPRA